MGAVIVSKEIADYFDDRMLYAGLTNYGHPLGCAAACAAMQAYQNEDLFQRAAVLQATLLAGLQRIEAKLQQASAARGRGLLAAIELELPPQGWQRLATSLESRSLLVHASAERGTVILAPPLVIEEDQLVEGLERLEEALREAAA
jgi:taurine--2-oxoglutarate transaminase